MTATTATQQQPTTDRGFWADAEVISRYTRRQAIEDGILVQLSGDGYECDDWIPAMCQEAGFRFPLAMTTAAFVDCVSPLSGGGLVLAPCQDARGRLWDILWMLKVAIRTLGNRGKPTDIVRFGLYRVPNIPAGSRRHPRQQFVRLKAVCGPGDAGEPVITIMLPEED